MTQFEIKNGIAIIPKGTTEIEKGAFKDCTSLEGITIPEGVVEIGYGAFFRCTSLKSIKIPESVTEIGEYHNSRVGKSAWVWSFFLLQIAQKYNNSRVGNENWRGCLRRLLLA